LISAWALAALLAGSSIRATKILLVTTNLYIILDRGGNHQALLRVPV